ncbi:MAG: prepilin-type N-terminal cleavage/methylation domain-containing protein [Desulfobacterales bacterium]|nr:prepilin-type N-terminal cleavage/methylation domain-containing protein [Desulfobacterales bacterium]
MAIFKPQSFNKSCGIQRRRCGFTLLEVMVAMAVLSIVLVSVYRMHSQTLTMNTAARFYTQAPLLAQKKLAEVATSSDGIFNSDSGDFGENYPGYTWQVTTNDVASELLGEVADDLKRIEVKVSYANNQFSFNLTTYRLQRD